ncbi:hypothetical protein [Pectinatus frisingensis]|uniref:hypothetical protein n=1 Tax=Pectinatus frisingensis TaxID=865 RepID=UPI0018C72D11|nr:hypothetical protein [Pectinatus frisingensis]
MENLIDMFQMQLNKYKELEKSVDRQMELLIKLDDAGFQKEIQATETLMYELSRVGREIDKIDLTHDKAAIVGLNKQIQMIAAAVRKKNAYNQVLVQKRMHFIQFNVNAATSTIADSSYSSVGSAGEHSVSKIKMFDQSI